MEAPNASVTIDNDRQRHYGGDGKQTVDAQSPKPEKASSATANSAKLLASSGRASDSDGKATRKRETAAAVDKYEMAAATVSTARPAKDTKSPEQSRRLNGKTSNECEFDGSARNSASNSARPTTTNTHTAGHQVNDRPSTLGHTPMGMGASTASTTYGQADTVKTTSARAANTKQADKPPASTCKNKRSRKDDDRPTYTDTVRLRNRDIIVTRPAPLPRTTQIKASNSDQRTRPPDLHVATPYRDDPTPAEVYGRDRPTAACATSNLTPIVEQSYNGQRLAMTTSLAAAAAQRSATAAEILAPAKCKLSTAERVPIIMLTLFNGEMTFDDWLHNECGGSINSDIINLLSGLHHHRKSHSQYSYERFYALKARLQETQDVRAWDEINTEMRAVKTEHTKLAAIGHDIRACRHEIKSQYRLARTPSVVSADTLDRWADKHRNDEPKATASQTDTPLVSDDDWTNVRRRNTYVKAPPRNGLVQPPTATAGATATSQYSRHQAETQTTSYWTASQTNIPLAGTPYQTETARARVTTVATSTADAAGPPHKSNSPRTSQFVSDAESSVGRSSMAHSGDESSSSMSCGHQKTQRMNSREQMALDNLTGLDSFLAQREIMGRPFSHGQVSESGPPFTQPSPYVNVATANRPSAFTHIAAQVQDPRYMPQLAVNTAPLTVMGTPIIDGQPYHWPAAALTAQPTYEIARRPQTAYAYGRTQPSDTETNSMTNTPQPLADFVQHFRPPTRFADVRRYEEQPQQFTTHHYFSQHAADTRRFERAHPYAANNDNSVHRTMASAHHKATDSEYGQNNKHETERPTEKRYRSNGPNDHGRNRERGRDGRSATRSIGRERQMFRKRGSDSSSSSRERKRNRGQDDSGAMADCKKPPAKTERPDADQKPGKQHRKARKTQVKIKALTKKIEKLQVKKDGGPSDSGPSSSNSDRSSFSSDASSEDEELCADKLSKSSFNEKEFKRRANIMDYDGEKESLDWRGFNGLAPYDPDSPEGERNFSNWHGVFVARANCQDLSYEGRKVALQCLTAGRAHVYVRHMAHKKYKYLVTRLQQIFGDGSEHVGYQEDYASQHQHGDEYVDSYAARWLKNWRKHLGSAFDPDTKKTVQDFIATLRSEYVKTHLSAKGYKRFDSAVAHGRRLEREEAEYKRSRGQTDRATEYERRAAVAKPAARVATHSKSPPYATTQRDTYQKAFWSARFRRRPRDEAAALDGDQAPPSPTESAINSENDVETVDDSTNAEQFLDLVNGELEMAIDRADKTNKTADAVEAERLRSEIGTLIVKLRQMENQLAKRKSTVSSAAPVGTCWKCGKSGHGWKLCPQRRPTDKLDGLPYKPAWAEEKLRRLRPTGPPRNSGRSDTTATNTMATPSPTAQQVQKYVAIPAADSKPSPTIMHSISCVADTDDDDALFVVASQQTDTDHASATGVLTATVVASATGVASTTQTNTASQNLRMDRLFIEIEIHNLKVKALLDTGATSNFLKTALFDVIMPRPPLQMTDQQFRSATGDPLDIAGVATLTTAIEGRRMDIPFYIARNLRGRCILGMLFLHSAGAVIDAPRRTLLLPDQPATATPITHVVAGPSSKVISVATITVTAVRSPTAPITLRAKSSVVIPPCTLYVLSATADELISDNCGLIVPDEHACCWIARCAVFPGDLSINEPIKLACINYAPTATEVAQGTILATLRTMASRGPLGRGHRHTNRTRSSNRQRMQHGRADRRRRALSPRTLTRARQHGRPTSRRAVR